MKKINHSIIILSSLAMLVSCDRRFEELNTNPQAVNEVDLGLLHANALRNTPNGGVESDQTLSQQFYVPFQQSTTLGFNANAFNEGQNNGRWNGAYGGPVKQLTHVVTMAKDLPNRSNLYNEARIWLAYNYMTLVDSYADVPYTEAGRAYLDKLFYPKYDNDETIYASLRTELKEASAALDPTKGTEATTDFFYQGDISKWKRLGYSLLLRLGMRYSRKDPNLARTIVQEAFTGGVMTSNADNAGIIYSTVNNNPLAGLANTNSNYFYFAEPFIGYLKSVYDPRLKYLAGKYADAGGNHSQVPDTTTANQLGFPIGESNVSITTYPGRPTPVNAGGGFNYSQINFQVLGNVLTPVHFVTNAQTQLLLAEAAFRGWLPSGALTAEQYYNAGVKASMDEYDLYPNTLKPKAVPTALQDAYLQQTNVKYNATDALKLINTQYWVASFRNGSEAWFNLTRSRFPVLTPNPKNLLPGDGFVHRFRYLPTEQGVNRTNYDAAKAAIGGDEWTTRVFWDVP
jgi:hypothetical protein